MKKIMVVLAGLPGKMAMLVAKAISEQGDMEIYKYALSEGSGQITIPWDDRQPRVGGVVGLVPADRHIDVLTEAKELGADLIVDFTQPPAVNRNAEMYCAAGVPFVMGTTGGDRELLFKTIALSGVSAVIATNMAAPVVMFQEMIISAAQRFPGGLKGFKLLRKESHQATKPDPSGTMAALDSAFSALIGVPCTKEQIIMVRDPLVQELGLGVPKQYLGGHGYHTYTLLSPDGTVMLEFTHNVLGRSVYVDGALRAIRFLAGQKGKIGSVFSMIDVLKGASK